MIADEELFFARRLGYGLRQSETMGSSARDWAVRQISAIPPLDFYGRGGANIRDHFPDFAEPVPDFANGARLWGEYADKEVALEDQVSKLDASVWQKRMEEEIYRPRTDYPHWRECLVRSLTAVNGPSPVFERFWSFWVNHFTVNANSFTKLLYGPHTRVIRDRMTGKFADLLRDAVLNPAMLYYLDNWLSTGPHSRSGLNHGPDGNNINENLARELLELHTMSPSAGYTQDDVIQVAYALSGWSIHNGDRTQDDVPKATPFGTYFAARRHEPGARKILGVKYEAGKKNGVGQALALLNDLAARPETARFISRKLVRHFVADVPPEDSVARVVQAWVDSGGDLVTIHTAVIDEVLAKAPDNPKFLTSETWFYQAHRTIGVDVPETAIYDYSDDKKYWVTAVAAELGQPYSECPQPNGWSDLQDDWISAVLLERRVRYAFQLGGQMQDASAPQYLKDVAARLSGPSSGLTSAMRDAPDAASLATILLSSPEFMRI
ncbi:MAG: DUF1800 family protein [Devosia sp.]